MVNTSSDLSIDLLNELIQVPSFVHEEKMGEVITKILKEQNYGVTSQEVEPHRYNIFATKNPLKKNKSILFYAHLDTVAPQGDWENPLIPHAEDEKITGVGSYDMKSGIVAILEAAKNTDAYIKIFFAVDEEKESLGAWDALKNNKDFFNDVELVVSAEPNFGLGLYSITNGRTGRSIYKIECQGKSSHIAKYKEGIDAIKLLGTFINSFYLQRDHLFNSKNTIAQIRKIEGESNGMTVCSNASAEIEVLLGAGDTSSSVIDVLQRLSDSLQVEGKVSLIKRRTPYLEPYYFEDFAYKKEIGDIIKKHLHKDMYLCQRSSVGDDNVIATLGIPVITWGPDGGNAHSSYEWVDTKSMTTLALMFHDLLIMAS